MIVVVHQEADEELAAAADWYEQEREGIGVERMAKARGELNAIAASPTTWPFVSGSRIVRSFLFTRFPYVAFFVVQSDKLFVMAFGHSSRRPGYWRGRLKQ